MRHTSVAALAFCGGALIASLLFNHTSSTRVFAAAPAGQAQGYEKVQGGQSQQQAQTPPNGQQPGKTGLKPLEPGKAMTPAEQEQWEMDHIIGLEVKVIQLQDQVNTMAATDQAAIHTLQASLQTLQTQFANHSHTVSVTLPGHTCVALDTYYLNNASTHQNDFVSLYHTSACVGHPDWNGNTPNTAAGVHVSLPTQGAN
jgi:hypothetical protein